LQSEHKSRHDSFQTIDAEVSRLDASPGVFRRRWSAEAKGKILAEALAPCANASAIARAHDLKPQQLFAWRRQALRSGLIGPLSSHPEQPAFVPMEIERVGGVELIVSGVMIRAGSDVTQARLIEVIRAARSA
jgi:transposase